MAVKKQFFIFFVVKSLWELYTNGYHDLFFTNNTRKNCEDYALVTTVSLHST